MGDSEVQLVVFELASESFGVDIAKVREIIVMQEIVRVPRSPRLVEGIINLRGQVIPVVDLVKRFRLTSPRDENKQRIVVVDWEGMTVGLKVDAVSEVLRLDRELITPPSPVLLNANLEYLEGIARLGERLVVLLNLQRVLSHKDSQEIASMMRQVDEKTCLIGMTKTT